jgi:DNA-binding MarR family transcriptional regulator
MSDEQIRNDDHFADLADVVLNLTREIRSRDAEVGAMHLTSTESHVMRFVDRHPGATSSELAYGTGLQRSNVSAALRALEGRGFVRRVQDSEDGRTVRVIPTALAAKNLRTLRTSWTALVSGALGEDEGGIQATLELLSRLEEGLIRARRESHLPPA